MTQKTQPKIMLGVLCYGGQVYWEWARCWHELLKTGVVGQVASVSGDSLVSRARNTICADFLASSEDHTHLMFIDCDIEFEPWMVHRLVAHNKPLIGGMYPIKQVRPTWVCNQIPGEKPDKQGLVKVRETGTGFMLIRRDVLQAMVAKFPELEFQTDDNEPGAKRRYDFFSVGPYTDTVTKKRRYLSEDYYFCQRWRDMGGDVWLDTRIQAKHIGRMTYPVPEADLRAAVKEYDRLLQPAQPIEEIKGNSAA